MSPSRERPRIVCVGEGMLELTETADGCRLGYGGDVLNTAIHLARSGCDAGLLTALGTDRFSDKLRTMWTDEGLRTDLLLTHPERHAGLYAVTVDAAGERSFTYWRSESAAREMFDLDGSAAATSAASGAAVLYYSLITLAILTPHGRAALLALAAGVRANGGRVAFDSNYRPRLWSSVAEARELCDAAIAGADIGLPTLEDEAALRGDGAVDADAVAARWQALGCTETVVKLGADGCRLPDGTRALPPLLMQPVDTSGAGDAFNAGYLAARLSGRTTGEAAGIGQALAGRVIMLPGAIPKVADWPRAMELAR